MSLQAQYKNIRLRTEEICTPLKVEDYGIQVVKFASPPKWHLAHTTWFYETFILLPFLNDYQPYNKHFNFLFNSYYNNIGDRVLQANRGNLSRPSTEKIYAYRQHVDTEMIKLLKNNPDQIICDLIQLGLQHEKQHQELLLTDIKYMLGHNAIFPVYAENSSLVKDKNIPRDNLKIKADVYEIGYQGNNFCYDNELGVHKVYLNDFTISNQLVTNGEFIAFMEAGGYTDFNLWLDEGWQWVNTHQIDSPLYWYNIDGEWHHYTLEGLQKVDKDTMLSHVSFYEANAYAEWKGMRLPTEFEWEIAAKQLDWGKRWEWTNSAYLPYPNFQKENGAVGEYNGKFMSNKMVLRGASTATSPNHSRVSYRNFFGPTERWQFTGIRLAK